MELYIFFRDICIKINGLFFFTIKAFVFNLKRFSMCHLETEFPLLSCLTSLLRWESQKRIVLCVVILILSRDGGRVLPCLHAQVSI